MLRKNLPNILLTLGILLQASPAPLHALGLGPAGFFLAAIPAGNAPVSPLTQADLDGNGALESLTLNNNRLSILDNGRAVWQSPQTWQVVQAAISDFNHDGEPEVTLLLWRPFRPWPVDQWLSNGGRIAEFQDSDGQSCHLILIGWKHDGFHELWAGSAMADPIQSFAIVDLNEDNVQELVALETRYTDPRSAPARTLKVWEWNGFGFTVVSYLDGTFSKLTLVQANNQQILILVP
jgi:hypothetical protein